MLVHPEVVRTVLKNELELVIEAEKVEMGLKEPTF